MAPDLARALIADYTQPGDWVLDPLAGIGTTHVEAIHLSRNAFGVEIDPGWVALARANIDLARSQGGTGTGRVIAGDATRLPRGIPTSLRGRFQLVLTSPPYVVSGLNAAFDAEVAVNETTFRAEGQIFLGEPDSSGQPITVPPVGQDLGDDWKPIHEVFGPPSPAPALPEPP